MKKAQRCNLYRYWVNGEEAHILDGYLRRMFRWLHDWQMHFNLESVQLCIWTREATHSHCEMGVGGSKVLRVSDEYRVLGVSMRKSTTPSGQCAKASRNAN